MNQTQPGLKLTNGRSRDLWFESVFAQNQHLCNSTAEWDARPVSVQKRMLLVSGLRRSGTTAFWEVFRNVPEVTAFDEPFHPLLSEGIRENPKGTWGQLSEFVASSGAVPVGISPKAELASGPSPTELAWMATLSESAPRVVMDVVRCWNRLPYICPCPEEVLYVSLVRGPASWVTGHLLPSGQGTWRKQIVDVWRKASFFSRKGFYDNYHYQTIIDTALATEHSLWRAVTMPIEDLRRAPAYIKLLAFWWGVNLRVHESLSNAGVARITLTLDDFANAPEQAVSRILEAMGWGDLQPDTSHVAGIRESFRDSNPHWVLAARALGIPEEIFTLSGSTSTALQSTFDIAIARGFSAR